MRHQFWHEKQLVYEWEQTLSDLNIFIKVPKGIKAKQIYVDISNKHLRVGIVPNPPYLERDFGGPVIVSESFWTLDGDELQIQLTKAKKGETWNSALAGHEIHAMEKSTDQKQLLLERFQQEHPGFDFSSAEFNGEAPNARTFMDEWLKTTIALNAGATLVEYMSGKSDEMKFVCACPIKHKYYHR